MAEPIHAAIPPSASASGLDSSHDAPVALSWSQFQAALHADGLYAGPVDGREGQPIWAAIEARFAREGAAGKLAEGWQTWPAPRRKIAVEQAIIRAAGIELGAIDGVVGRRTQFGRESFQLLQATGQPPIMPQRDVVPAQPVPSSGPATLWPRQAECETFYGLVGEGQTMLALPYRMRLAWDLNTTISRFSCHEKVHDAFLRVFQKTLAEHGEARIAELRLDVFGGCLNVRKMRGGSGMSMHSWGIAIDLDPERNRLNMTHANAAFARAEYAPFWQIVESEGLVSLGRVRDFDWMHFQAARL